MRPQAYGSLAARMRARPQLPLPRRCPSCCASQQTTPPRPPAAGARTGEAAAAALHHEPAVGPVLGQLHAQHLERLHHVADVLRVLRGSNGSKLQQQLLHSADGSGRGQRQQALTATGGGPTWGRMHMLFVAAQGPLPCPPELRQCGLPACSSGGNGSSSSPCEHPPGCSPRWWCPLPAPPAAGCGWTATWSRAASRGPPPRARAGWSATRRRRGRPPPPPPAAAAGGRRCPPLAAPPLLPPLAAAPGPLLRGARCGARCRLRGHGRRGAAAGRGPPAPSAGPVQPPSSMGAAATGECAALGVASG